MLHCEDRFCEDCFNLDENLDPLEKKTTMMGYYECLLCGANTPGKTAKELLEKARDQLRTALRRLRALHSGTE